MDLYRFFGLCSSIIVSLSILQKSQSHGHNALWELSHHETGFFR